MAGLFHYHFMQNAFIAGTIVAVGGVFTFTIREAEPVQVFASVTVTE